MKDGDQQQQEEPQMASPPAKRPKIYPSERILIYVRQPQEEIFAPLHISPPSVEGLLLAVRRKVFEFLKDSNFILKFQLYDYLHLDRNTCTIDQLLRQTRKG